jgi:hypothetical protein
MLGAESVKWRGGCVGPALNNVERRLRKAARNEERRLRNRLRALALNAEGERLAAEAKFGAKWLEYLSRPDVLTGKAQRKGG